MRLRTGLLLAIIGTAVVGWWLAHPRSALPRPEHPPLSGCPLPPIATRDTIPLQSPVPSGLALPAVSGAKVTPLAGFSVEARVLGLEPYSLGREAEYSPADLAVGWGRMRDDAVLDRLSFRHGGRFFRYRWEGQPPIPQHEIIRSVANMHIVPANDEVTAALKRVRIGQQVRVDGWLVRIDAADGWHWRSSLTREDDGNGACELVYTCAITPR